MPRSVPIRPSGDEGLGGTGRRTRLPPGRFAPAGRVAPPPPQPRRCPPPAQGGGLAHAPQRDPPLVHDDPAPHRASRLEPAAHLSSAHRGAEHHADGGPPARPPALRHGRPAKAGGDARHPADPARQPPRRAHRARGKRCARNARGPSAASRGSGIACRTRRPASSPLGPSASQRLRPSASVVRSAFRLETWAPASMRRRVTVVQACASSSWRVRSAAPSDDRARVLTTGSCHSSLIWTRDQPDVPRVTPIGSISPGMVVPLRGTNPVGPRPEKVGPGPNSIFSGSASGRNAPMMTELRRSLSRWCPGEDSNLHGVTHWYLKPARLPIPPPGPRRCF